MLLSVFMNVFETKRITKTSIQSQLHLLLKIALAYKNLSSYWIDFFFFKFISRPHGVKQFQVKPCFPGNAQK